MREFAVGVFEHEGKRSTRLEAYTRYFNPSWKGCCVHRVQAHTGTEAKEIAKRDHREYHMKEPEHRCMECKAPVASPGLCGECSCEDDSAIW